MRRCSTCGHAFEPDRRHHRTCWACWRAARAGGPPPRPAEPDLVAATFDARTWRRLLALVHPDRHAGREAEATEIAQLVADQLDAARAAERERVPR